ncbi:hypothetical protein T08_3740 [Trichinella sp. T8]|uniref:RING-type domain-containing protein n=1 Tax=Trichinella murrelli TaxID=144512 RepID=A0A0V0U6X2_9BILA|nr:hypothetical protein T05_1777 [Trichinella murrelli]KRZ93119.1 hypothetical protein T08_3740 [Trichinella sp. T8]
MPKTNQTVTIEDDNWKAIIMCSICWKSPQEEENSSLPMYSTKCGHVLCVDCKIIYFPNKHSKKPCPMCRTTVKKSSLTRLHLNIC